MPYYIRANIQFMKNKYLIIAISGCLVLFGILCLIIRGGPILGIDFSGGMMFTIKFNQPEDIGEIRNTLSSLGLGDSVIQSIGNQNNEVQIRVKMPKAPKEKSEASMEQLLNTLSKQVVDALRDKFDHGIDKTNKLDLNMLGADSLKDIFKAKNPLRLTEENFATYDQYAIKIANKKLELGGIFSSFQPLESIEGLPATLTRFVKEQFYLSTLIVEGVEIVGPHVSQDLQTKAFWATMFALAGMLVYIWVRFEFLWGLSGVLFLFHDVLFTLGLFTLMNREINLPVIAAFLTLIGYSINDTIVVFDRIRENLNVMRGKPLDWLINTSINQTLSRTLLTVLTVFFVAAMLFFFGGKTLNDFSFIVLIGILVGTFSSVASSTVILLWRDHERNKKITAIASKK